MARVLETRTYRCPKCGVLLKRLSDKQWIRSYCEEKGVFTRLIIVSKDIGIAKEDATTKTVSIDMFNPC